MTTASLAPAYFPLVPGSKMPLIKGWQHVQPGIYPPVGDHGRNLNEHDLIIDVDPRNYPDGRNVFGELQAAHPLPPTRIVQTPSGGFHYCYRKPADIKVKKKQAAYPGIDFLSAGQFVAEPGSHIRERGVYKLVSDLEPASIPELFLASLERKAEALYAVSDASTSGMRSFILECQAASIAVSGKNGNDATYKRACRGRDQALPLDSTFQIMRDHWNDRCDPPWDLEDLYEIVEHAYTHAKNAFGCDSPESKFLPEHAAPPDKNVVSIDSYQQDLATKGIHATAPDIDKRGNPKATLGNMIYLLRHDPAWQGRIRLNQFSSTLEFSSRPDWRWRRSPRAWSAASRCRPSCPGRGRCSSPRTRRSCRRTRTRARRPA